MADLPILFSAPMVRALLAGSKTQTRRVLNPQPVCEAVQRAEIDDGVFAWFRSPIDTYADEEPLRVRFAPGDRLYVREAWRAWKHLDSVKPSTIDDRECITYAADGEPTIDVKRGRLRAAMHMPRWASRITLHVTEVRVQRLREISEEDAKAEGAIRGIHYVRTVPNIDGLSPYATFREGYANLWEIINGERSWAMNPWAVAVSFAVEKVNIDHARAAA